MTDTTMSASISNLLEAYVLAQGQIDNVLQDREVEVPIKDKANPGQYKGKYKFRYATLPGILSHIRKALTDNGIWYTQFVRSGMMVTRLLHKSGEWMDTGDVPMPDIKGSPQDIGAIISYFKRYSLTEAMGLAAEDDSDGTIDSEVSFRARGAARAQESAEGGEVEEPPQGWGDWARGLLAIIAEKSDNEELDALRDTNKRQINAVRRIDKAMYDAIGKAFEDRRAVVNDDVPF